MSTITKPELALTILENDGVYPGDPQIHSMWKYGNAWNHEIAYAIFYAPEHFDLEESPAVEWYYLLWSRESGITLEGAEELARLKKEVKGIWRNSRIL